MKSIVSVIIVLLCLLVCGCSSSGTDAGSNESAQEASSQSSPQSEPEQSTPQSEQLKPTPAEDLSYEIIDNTVTIKGYLGDDKHIVIPETIEGVKVVTIGEAAFFGSDIESIVLPDTVTEIKKDAFSYCKNLTSVQLSNRLKTIATHAFANCEKLSEIRIPNSLSQIRKGTFQDCTGLTKVEIPDGVTSIGQEAFSGTGLVEVDLPESITRIGYQAFRCADLQNVTGPDSLDLYLNHVFEGCPDDLTVNGEPLPKDFYVGVPIGLDAEISGE